MSTNTQPVHVVSLAAVRRVYHTGAAQTAALDGVDLQISAGEFVAIIGRSGSGKTTLLQVLTGIDRPTSGAVRVGGQDLRGLSEDALATWRGRNVGVVFQFFQLLPTLTVLENVMLPMELCGTCGPTEARARAAALLDRVGVADQAHKLPQALSGGQQQRVAIARALANDPSLLVADEPTGNLDSTSADGVFALLEGLARGGTTVILVTHERGLAERTDRVITLADGRITSDLRRSQP